MAEPVPDPAVEPPADAPAAADDPLAALRGHVRDAQLAAERIARAATARRADTGRAGSSGAPGAPTGATGSADCGAGASRSTAAGDEAFPETDGRQPRTPPSGWEASADDEHTHAELRALLEMLESLRAMLPDELREQLNDLIRQILLLMRAVIDWLVARMEREPPPRPEGEAIQDIPIS